MLDTYSHSKTSRQNDKANLSHYERSSLDDSNICWSVNTIARFVRINIAIIYIFHKSLLIVQDIQVTWHNLQIKKYQRHVSFLLTIFDIYENFRKLIMVAFCECKKRYPLFVRPSGSIQVGICTSTEGRT